MCHPAQLPFLCGSGLTPDPSLFVGLRRAITGSLGSRGAGGISLSLRLARTQSHGHPRRRVLCHTLCVDSGLAGALNAAGIFSTLSPQADGAAGSTTLSSTAIVALRTRDDGVVAPSVPVRSTVNLFPHWCNGNYGEVYAVWVALYTDISPYHSMVDLPYRYSTSYWLDASQVDRHSLDS